MVDTVISPWDDYFYYVMELAENAAIGIETDVDPVQGVGCDRVGRYPAVL